MLAQTTLGFLGAGAMAEALIRGVLAAGLVAPDRIWVTNRSNRERLESLARRFGVRTTPRKAEVVAAADLLVVACKPKDVPDLLAEVGRLTRPGQVLLSVAAGVPTRRFLDEVTPGVQVVRAMPNTSCLVRESATAICGAPGTGPEALALARELLGAVGRVVEVPEDLMDAVTGLSGSGPAYVYLMVEAMEQAGVQVGLDSRVARELAVQTLLGAARMLVETGADPAVLRQQVTSPGGTTMAGLQVLREMGFAEALARAVARAAERSRELGALVAAPQATGG
ncbi:MAG: pyrroline-5-carboxylate reductase [Bacillota bacterium]|nr:MAG: pyrroline-5-carboxylate reductase [Bacillota bacterium]